MIDPNKVTEAVMEFVKEPGWMEVFMNAPAGAKERMAVSFYFSKFHDGFTPEDFQEYRDLREEYEKSLTEEDLTYLIDYSDKEDAKSHYGKLLEQLRQNGGKPTGTLGFDSNQEADNGAEGMENDGGTGDGDTQSGGSGDVQGDNAESR